MLKLIKPGTWEIKIQKGLPNTCSADEINMSTWEHREKVSSQKIQYYPKAYPSKIPESKSTFLNGFKINLYVQDSTPPLTFTRFIMHVFKI